MSKRDRDFQILLNNARIAGLEAVEKLIKSNGVVPMVVSQHASPLDDSSPVQKSWFVPDGPCGFAWIKIKPGNSPFANWLKKQTKDKGRRQFTEILLPEGPAYSGGVDVWVSGFDQSVQKKETYAAAFAGVLHAAGIYAYSQSRLD